MPRRYCRGFLSRGQCATDYSAPRNEVQIQPLSLVLVFDRKRKCPASTACFSVVSANVPGDTDEIFPVTSLLKRSMCLYYAGSEILLYKALPGLWFESGNIVSWLAVKALQWRTLQRTLLYMISVWGKSTEGTRTRNLHEDCFRAGKKIILQELKFFIKPISMIDLCTLPAHFSINWSCL